MACREKVSFGLDNNFLISGLHLIRMDVGGKLLTNQLKEVVSYRQWNMMDETYIMNHAKESCCYVSTQFLSDLETCRYVVAYGCVSGLFILPSSKPKKNSIVLEYLLPNFSINRNGQIRPPGYELTPTDQVLLMENERFTIPELLFRPDDIGLLFETYAHWLID